MFVRLVDDRGILHIEASHMNTLSLINYAYHVFYTVMSGRWRFVDLLPLWLGIIYSYFVVQPLSYAQK